uniref:Uncharacterized protein n=1 Tax=Vespula pensylvanica TaxID=30213 RepID=A0A834P2B1_VESPE|nr:hypothetical protein H0235_007862 [Vespula pensylvanica]
MQPRASRQASKQAGKQAGPYAVLVESTERDIKNGEDPRQSYLKEIRPCDSRIEVCQGIPDSEVTADTAAAVAAVAAVAAAAYRAGRTGQTAISPAIWPPRLTVMP